MFFHHGNIYLKIKCWFIEHGLGVTEPSSIFYPPPSYPVDEFNVVLEGIRVTRLNAFGRHFLVLVVIYWLKKIKSRAQGLLSFQGSPEKNSRQNVNCFPQIRFRIKCKWLRHTSQECLQQHLHKVIETSLQQGVRPKYPQESYFQGLGRVYCKQRI